MGDIGHGHVFPRSDGIKARCGGPVVCDICAHDLAIKQEDERRLNMTPPNNPSDKPKEMPPGLSVYYDPMSEKPVYEWWGKTPHSGNVEYISKVEVDAILKSREEKLRVVQGQLHETETWDHHEASMELYQLREKAKQADFIIKSLQEKNRDARIHLEKVLPRIDRDTTAGETIYREIHELLASSNDYRGVR